MSDRWITVRESVPASANMNPNFPSTLFGSWLLKGWQVQSVSVLPPTSADQMCVAVGVLRKYDPNVIG